jgi:hypothetical protein
MKLQRGSGFLLKPIRECHPINAFECRLAWAIRGLTHAPRNSTEKLLPDSFFLSNFFVLILKRVQHRYKEAILRPFDSSTSSLLRAQDKATQQFS